VPASLARRTTPAATCKETRGRVANTSLAGLAALYSARPQSRRAAPGPRIAVVGAGIAGLNVAYVLRQSGYDATVFEAAARSGGRIRTVYDELGPGLVTELGGEFIDSSHLDMRALARAFGLPLIDTAAASERALASAYFFQGQHYSEEQVTDAFAPLARRIAADHARLSRNITARRHTEADKRYDNMSVLEYLDRIGATGMLRCLLEVAYVTEFGLDADQISAIELISLIDKDTGGGLALFGESDQRYKIAGGNACVTQELSRRLGSAVRPEHRLVSVRRHAGVLRLTFDTPGAAQAVDADWVVLALPFSVLRHTDTGDVLSPAQRDIVAHLGYGTNAKLAIGLAARPWRMHGFNGDLYSDAAFQTGWDSSRLQPAQAGAFTFYLGGSQGVAIGSGTPGQHASRLSGVLDQVYPGIESARTQAVLRAHWPSEPFACGSYSCRRPGQWTSLGGETGRRDGTLLFAGEHCSTRFQGYMNGAAETGRRAAQAIISALR
jgi:monoamine oxidase